MYNVSSSVFLNFSALLRYLGKIRTTDSLHEEILEQLWSSLRALVSDSVTSYKSDDAAVVVATDEDSNGQPSAGGGKDELEKRLRIHQKAINALKNPTDGRQKKQTRVGAHFDMGEVTKAFGK